MVKRLLILFAFALGGCGAGAAPTRGLNVSILVDGAVGPVDTYRVRVFGAAVKCADVLAAPANFELGSESVCAAAEMESSTDCVIAFDAFDASGEVQPINQIPPGERALFVEGVSGGAVVAHGCASVSVQSGQSSSATVTLE